MAAKKDAAKESAKSGGAVAKGKAADKSDKSEKGAAAKTTGGGANAAGSGGDGGSKRLTQTEIINQLADKSGLKRQQAKDFMNELADMAISEVQRSGEFTLPGFGKLVLSERKEREGRNPATGAKITIPAKTTLKFRIGKALRDNAGGDNK